MNEHGGHVLGNCVRRFFCAYHLHNNYGVVNNFIYAISPLQAQPHFLRRILFIGHVSVILQMITNRFFPS